MTTKLGVCLYHLSTFIHHQENKVCPQATKSWFPPSRAGRICTERNNSTLAEQCSYGDSLKQHGREETRQLSIRRRLLVPQTDSGHSAQAERFWFCSTAVNKRYVRQGTRGKTSKNTQAQPSVQDLASEPHVSFNSCKSV